MFRKFLGFLTERKTRMVSIRKIDAGFDVTSQLSPDQLVAVSKLGYKTVICMRPDNEGFSQPTFAEMENAARGAGVETFYLPVVPGAITPDQARKLKAILASQHGPVLAYCASGNRCAAAYDLSKRA